MRLDWYVDIAGNTLVANPFGPAPFVLPPIRQGDTIPLRVYLLQRTTSYPNSFPGYPAFEILNNSDLSLKVAIGTKAGNGDGDHVASQFTWSKDSANQYFYADLALNTAEMIAAFGSSPTLSRVLEIEATRDGVPFTSLQQEVTIHADVIKDAAVALQAGETALTLNYANATFAKNVGDPGQVFQLVSPNGQWIRTLGITDEGVRIDQVEEVV